MIDLLICGAGPAGLATALYGARAGLEVVVLDARPAPIDKACGEGLMPAAVRALRELGVDPIGHDFAGIRYTDGTRQADARFRAGPGRGVRRLDLQAALLSAACAAGVSVRQQRLGAIAQDEHGVDAAGLRARYLVAADGLHSPIRTQLGLDRLSPGRLSPARLSPARLSPARLSPARLSPARLSPARLRPARRAGVPARAPRWGQRQHFAVSPWSEFVEVHWAATSEAYVTPIAPDLVGVAVLSSTRAPYAEQLIAFPALLERLSATGASSIRGAGPLRQRVRHRIAGRVLLVGDAAGYCDALTGEGIAVGVVCAQALVECVLDGTPERYEQRWRALSRRSRLITESLLWARNRSLLAGTIVPAAARAPRLFEAAVHQLAR